MGLHIVVELLYWPARLYECNIDLDAKDAITRRGSSVLVKVKCR